MKVVGHGVKEVDDSGDFALDRVREEDTPGERRREPVRQPEVGIRLGQRRRDPAQARREHHRPCDVAACAEHHVRTPAREDPAARERRADSLRECTNETDADAPREARDGERVELEARVRNELRLDAASRPCERHRHPARAKCFADCESRPYVSGGPSRCDHAPKPRRPVH